MTPMRFPKRQPGDSMITPDGSRYVVDSDGGWMLDCGDSLPMAVKPPK